MTQFKILDVQSALLSTVSRSFVIDNEIYTSVVHNSRNMVTDRLTVILKISQMALLWYTKVAHGLHLVFDSSIRISSMIAIR